MPATDDGLAFGLVEGGGGVGHDPVSESLFVSGDGGDDVVKLDVLTDGHFVERGEGGGVGLEPRDGDLSASD